MKTGSRTWPGRWRCEELAAGLWRLVPEPPDGTEVHALGVERHSPMGASDPAGGGAAERLDLEWRVGSVEITRHGAPSGERFSARAVLVQEPLPELYARLPLERLDRRARRFWARVFWLVRMPGGRGLLRWLARRR